MLAFMHELSDFLVNGIFWHQSFFVNFIIVCLFEYFLHSCHKASSYAIYPGQMSCLTSLFTRTIERILNMNLSALKLYTVTCKWFMYRNKNVIYLLVLNHLFHWQYQVQILTLGIVNSSSPWSYSQQLMKLVSSRASHLKCTVEVYSSLKALYHERTLISPILSSLQSNRLWDVKVSNVCVVQ